MSHSTAAGPAGRTSSWCDGVTAGEVTAGTATVGGAVAGGVVRSGTCPILGGPGGGPSRPEDRPMRPIRLAG